MPETTLAVLAADSTSPAEYWYYKGLENRTIIMNGEIDYNIIETVILPLKQMVEENPTKPIKIYMNCVGGSVWDGLVLCDLLDSITCPVEIEVLGYALSMGMTILMGGFNNPNVTKTCHPFSFGLIHAGSVSLAGDAKKVKQTQRFNEQVDEKIKDYILTHSNITEELYAQHEDEEWYLHSEDMLNLGIVDKII